MNEKTKAERPGKEEGVTRRKFVALTTASGAAVLAGGSKILHAATATAKEGNSMFKIGGAMTEG